MPQPSSPPPSRVIPEQTAKAAYPPNQLEHIPHDFSPEHGFEIRAGYPSSCTATLNRGALGNCFPGVSPDDSVTRDFLLIPLAGSTPAPLSILRVLLRLCPF